jgi:hypothetical protein
MKNITPFKEVDKMYGRYHVLVNLTGRGYRNGYLGIPEAEYLKKIDPDTVEDTFNEVHGGVTFHGAVPANGRKEFLYVGFDCNHIGDRPDFKAMKGIFTKEEIKQAKQNWETFGGERLDDKEWTVRDLDYVDNEVGSMLHQYRGSDELFSYLSQTGQRYELYEKWLTGESTKDFPEDAKLFIKMNGLED